MGRGGAGGPRGILSYKYRQDDDDDVGRWRSAGAAYRQQRVGACASGANRDICAAPAVPPVATVARHHAATSPTGLAAAARLFIPLMVARSRRGKHLEIRPPERPIEKFKCA
jgi:hypothetical protein